MSNNLVSICMPYFNRIEPLKKTLQSYQDCGYFESKTFSVEVCICDDGSTKEPITEIEPRPWLKTLQLPAKESWKCACVPINRSVEMSSGALILLTSPEVMHPKPILWEMFSKLSDWKDTVLACVKNFNGNKISWYSHPVHRPARYWWCQMMNRELFDKVHGFDESYRNGRGWEDDDFVERLDKAKSQWKWIDEDHYVEHLFLGGKPAEVLRKGENKKRFFKKYGKKDTRGFI